MVEEGLEEKGLEEGLADGTLADGNAACADLNRGALIALEGVGFGQSVWFVFDVLHLPGRDYRSNCLCTYAVGHKISSGLIHDSTRQQSQPIWVSAFLDRATDVTPTTTNMPATPVIGRRPLQQIVDELKGGE